MTRPTPRRMTFPELILAHLRINPAGATTTELYDLLAPAFQVLYREEVGMALERMHDEHLVAKIREEQRFKAYVWTANDEAQIAAAKAAAAEEAAHDWLADPDEGHDPDADCLKAPQ